MDDAEERLLRFAAKHHGLYRLEDARRVGLSDRRTWARVRRGLAEREGTGLFRITGSPRTRHQRILSATWRTNGAASHRTSAELDGLIEVSTRRPDVTVGPHSGHEFHDVCVHRSTDLLPSDVRLTRGIRTTTTARTLVDIGLTVGDERLEKMVHRALHRGLIQIDDLVETYNRVSRQGRNGAGPIGALLRSLDPSMAPAESDLETLLVRIIRQHGLPEPVRQLRLELDGQVFRLDFAYPEQMLFLEGDGFGVHGGRTSFEEDRWRQNLLVLHGWWPLRFTWRQIRNRSSQVAGQIRRKLDDLS